MPLTEGVVLTIDVLPAAEPLSAADTLTAEDGVADDPAAFLVATLPDIAALLPAVILFPTPPLTEDAPPNTLSEPTLLRGPSTVAIFPCPGLSGMYPGPCP